MLEKTDGRRFYLREEIPAIVRDEFPEEQYTWNGSYWRESTQAELEEHDEWIRKCKEDHHVLSFIDPDNLKALPNSGL